MDNLFTILFKYRKEENRFTSAVFYFLKRLWEGEEDRQCCAKLLKALCNEEIKIRGDIEFVIQGPQEIHKQTGDKRIIVPDLVIRSVGKSKRLLVLLEVKDESKAGKSQVKDYIGYLNEKRKEYTKRRLVLLSRERDSLDIIEDYKLLNKVSWNLFFILLKGLEGELKDKVNVFILYSLIEFLKEKGMVDLTRITKGEFESGIKQCASFLAMLEIALKEYFPNRNIVQSFDEAIYLGYRFSGRPVSSIGIKVDQPGELRMYVKKTGVLDDQKLNRAKSRGSVQEDDYYTDEIYVPHSLSEVYKESNPHKQKEMIKKYIAEMDQTCKKLRRK